MRFFFLLIVALSFTFAQRLDSFKYCGHIEVLGMEGGMPMMPPMMMNMRGYVSPTGIDPQPPRTCVWVFFEVRSGDAYVPTIVVWSDTYTGYHADIYSDPNYIFGHRGKQPSDYSLSGLEARNREMENYLSNASGSRVIEEALRAYRGGKRETTFETVIDVPIPMSPDLIPKLRVKYYLYDFQPNPIPPPEVTELMRTGKAKRIPHTASWTPVRVSASLVD